MDVRALFRLGSSWVVVASVACGGPRTSAAPAAATAAPAPLDDGASPAATAPDGGATRGLSASASEAIPTSCAQEGAAPCVPDPAFVKRLCNGSFPDVALALLGKNTPFSRVYVKGDTDAWNADGGASARARLRFDEEMLVLRRRTPPANGIVVGAGGGYLVMRWDGNCYTLEDGELTARKPPSPRHSPIPWRFLSEPTRDALLARPKVLAAFQKRGKECKGAVSGEVTRACEQADTALSSAIVAEVRAGIALPKPQALP